MKDSPQRKHSLNSIKTIYRIYQEKPNQLNKLNKKQLNAKETKRFYDAQNYYDSVVALKENINTFFEVVIIDSDNLILDSSLIAYDLSPTNK